MNLLKENGYYPFIGAVYALVRDPNGRSFENVTIYGFVDSLDLSTMHTMLSSNVLSPDSI